MSACYPFLRFRSADEFLAWYEDNGDGHVRNGQAVLSQLLDAAPRKVCWGSDVALPWNTEDRAFDTAMEATARILDGVPERHHAAFKRENARRLFDL